MSYFFIFYNITISQLFRLDSFRFIFLLRDSENDLFHSLRTIVFPLSLYRNESSIGERTLYKNLLLIRIFRKTVRQEQIQDTKSTRKVESAVFPNRTERACLSYSRIQCSKHKSDLFCHRIKRVVLINQTSVFTFTLTLPIILN